MYRLLNACILIISVFYWLLAGINTPAHAQGPGGGRWQQIVEARKEFVKSRIRLRPEQEERFWKDYEEYMRARQQLLVERRRLKPESVSRTASDAELYAFIEQHMALKKREIELEEQYYRRFKSYLTAEQLFELHKTEQEFVRWLLEELRERRR
ncbi:MAG: hypothetical protein KatS3mg033_0250 [Thermonema sp.]|uniref:hypothetical protein n=1 Tax=Thermonema sp. TaxID=2231181 RepID=UPI0021DC05A6|nr:hypothetical protein [Thermonema sp.]GIV38450.1 MAG: hypothetical protein KatS3mg033_0250 [Thermonema sp.]